MDFVLKAKHWQVFIVLMIFVFMVNISIESLPYVNIIMGYLGIFLFMLWYWMLGDSLLNLLPPKIEISNTLFLVNGAIIVLSFAVVVIVFNGHYTGNGILGFLWVMYLFYALFQFGTFPMRVLKSLEQRREVSSGEAIGSALLMFFWPIGIWFVQPRINKVTEEISNS